ncbi:transcription factor GTE6 isoform X1 [Henckelia pumila]|uniref:transcription factor GTE6 isoform X1 n=1 Tax=Henckelia pumila TaxID=405737 RepID=UPI003C6E0D53
MDAEHGVVHETLAGGSLANIEVESLNRRVDEICVEVDELEQKLNDVERFYSSLNTKQSNTPRGNSIGKEKDREKSLVNFKKRQQDVANREAAAAKRMQDLMRQLGTIIRQITQHKWAGPFMQPVDVEGLGLHDYYKVIEKPMDFSTIKSKMEAKDGTGYKNVRELSADVRLIFKNAIKYNEERDDVHVMALTLLDKFETKWLQLLPKVDEEEKRLKDEEADMQLDIQLAQEAAHAKMARDLSFELDEFDMHLEELRDTVLQKCRKMSTEEKKRLGTAIARLSPEDINKALEIVAQNDPNFQAIGETVEVDINAQSELTLWRLKLFVKDRLQTQPKSSPSTGVKNEIKNENNQNNNNNNKRKREICCALARSSSQKRSKKPPN